MRGSEHDGPAAGSSALALRLSRPEGWVMELAFGHPAGRAQLSVGASAADGEAVDHLAARHADAIEGLPEYNGKPMVSRMVSEVPLLLRHYGWRPQGGERLEQVALYRADGDVAWVGILTAEQHPSPKQVDAAAEIVSTLTHESQTLTRDYSVEELTALAELHGAPGFPGVEHAFPNSSARLSAHRALTARGTLRPGGDGVYGLDPLDLRLIGLALAPLSTVTVDYQGDVGSIRRTLYVGSEVSLLRTPTIAGVHRLTAVPTTRLGALLGELTQLHERPPAPGGALSVSDETFRTLRDAALVGRIEEADAPEADVERLRAVLASVVSSSHLRMRGTSGGSMHGGELVWLDAGELGLWRLRPLSGRVSLEPLALGELGRAFDELWTSSSNSGPRRLESASS